MRTSDFHYDLPPELIAQVPADRRDISRLLVLNRSTGHWVHSVFHDLGHWIPSNAVLVVNDSKVIPARLRARNPETGGEFEVLLLEAVAKNDWWAMVRPGKRAPIGRELVLVSPEGSPTPWRAKVTEVNAEGHRRLHFDGGIDLLTELASLGEMPLPPYMKRESGGSSALDIQRYQTVYASAPGSVAAPTAGLHFTPELLMALRARKIEITSVTLHVGVGTFAPVKSETLEGHRMHSERYEIPTRTAELVNQARHESRPVIAVGTTSLRVLESVARDGDGNIAAGCNRTQIFIHPPHTFAITQGLITNFHLPQSTLLMLVSAFATPGSLSGRELIMKAYQEAIARRYRFFSYGDAMFIS